MTAKIVITLVTAAAIVLLDAMGLLKGSVGGPMVLLMVLLLAALVVGLHEAWSMRRGVVGWIVSVLVALVGAIIGGLVSGTVMDLILTAIRFEGKPGFLLAPISIVITLGGAWMALWLVNRLR